MIVILALLPFGLLLFPPFLIEVATRSHSAAFAVFLIEGLIALLLSLTVERRMIVRTRARPAPPQLARQITDGISLRITPDLERRVAWAKAPGRSGVIFLSRALLVDRDDQSLNRALRWGVECLRRPDSSPRSLFASLAEIVSRWAPLQLDAVAPASVVKLAWGMMWLPVRRAFEIWAGTTSYRL